MKAIRFVANISYNDVSKPFSVLWVDTAFEDVLKAVGQEFEIPSYEVSEKILCDLDGTSHTKDSFEDYVCRSFSEGRVPKFRVITSALSDNAVTSTTTQSECKEDENEPEGADLSSTASNLLSNFNRLEEMLNKAEKKLRLHRTEIESIIRGEPQPTEPTHHPHEPKADILVDGQKRELEARKEKLNLFQKALLEFESSLEKKEKTLDQRDTELNKLRRTLNRHDEKLKNREGKITCRRSEVAFQQYSLYQLQDILYGLSSDMKTTRKNLDEHAYALNLEEAMLDEQKKKIKGSRTTVKPKGKRCKLEVDSWNLDGKEGETTFNEGASASSQLLSIALSERILMELGTQAGKRRGSASSEILDEKQAKLNTPSIEDEQAISTDFKDPFPVHPMKLNNQQTLKTTRKVKAKKTSN